MVLEKKSILIVDDNEFFIQQQITCLGRERFDIHTAVSGKGALDKVRSLKPDLLLLDHIMEDMMSPEICRILKADPATAHIPIIIVSSGEQKPSRLRNIEAGCDGIIFKPIRRDQLLTLVEEFLGIAVRHWSRAPVSLPCIAMHEGDSKEAMILSLGGGGAFMCGELSLIRGDTFPLWFSLPDPGGEIGVREAIVVWLGLLEGNGPEGAGIKFLTISRDDQEVIDRYVASLPEVATADG